MQRKRLVAQPLGPEEHFCAHEAFAAHNARDGLKLRPARPFLNVPVIRILCIKRPMMRLSLLTNMEKHTLWQQNVTIHEPRTQLQNPLTHHQLPMLTNVMQLCRQALVMHRRSPPFANLTRRHVCPRTSRMHMWEDPAKILTRRILCQQGSMNQRATQRVTDQFLRSLTPKICKRVP